MSQEGLDSVLRRWERRLIGIVAVLAALPSTVWAFRGASYLSDDYWLSYWFDEYGIVETLRRLAFEMPARPVASIYLLILYEVIGNRPIIQALLLTALNAGLIVALWCLARNHIPIRVLVPSLAVFAVLPNLGSARLWFVVGFYPLALIVTCAALILALRRRPVSASLLLVTAVLLYEAVAGFAIAVLLIAFVFRPDLRRTVVVALSSTVLAAGFSYWISPRRAAASGVGPFGNAETLGSGLFGYGLVPVDGIAQVLPYLFFGTVAVAVAVQLPSFRRTEPEWTWILCGAFLVAGGGGPALVGGSAFAVAGIGERTNLVPSVGTALILGSIASLIARRAAVVAWSGGGALLAVFSYFSLADVSDYRASVRVGEELVEAVSDLVPDHRRFSADDRVLVGPSVEAAPGVAAFVPNVDIWGAMRLHSSGDWEFLRLSEMVSCSTLGAGSERWFVLDWRERTLEQLSGEELEDRCKTFK